MSGLFSPLRRRAYGQLLVGQFLSNIGDGAFLIAVVTVMVVHRDSPRDLGIVLAARSLVSLVALVGGGILADRFRRTRVMAVTDSARVVLVAAAVSRSRRVGGHATVDSPRRADRSPCSYCWPRSSCPCRSD